MQRYVRSGNLPDIEPMGAGAMRVPCLSRRTTRAPVRRWAEQGVDGAIVILLRLMLAGAVTKHDVDRAWLGTIR